jgi:hypothetical protein
MDHHTDLRSTARTGILLTVVLLVSLAGWIVLMAVQGAAISPDWSVRDYLAYASRGGFAYSGAYINALLFTAFAVALLILLCHRFRGDHPILSKVTMGFIPIYGVMNIVAYGSQVTFTPPFAARALALGDQGSMLAAVQAVHIYPGSIIGQMNALAYTVVGIPSVLLGIALWKTDWPGKTAAALLIVNAAACLLGTIGMAVGHTVLAFGTAAGGVLFTVAIVFLLVFFVREARTSAGRTDEHLTTATEANG